MGKRIGEIFNWLGEKGSKTIAIWTAIVLIVSFLLMFLLSAYFQPMGVIWGLLMGLILTRKIMTEQKADKQKPAPKKKRIDEAKKIDGVAKMVGRNLIKKRLSA